MDNRVPHGNQRTLGLAARLDKAAQGLNALLLVLAIGLAVLDATFFCAFEVRDALPSIARANAGPPAVSQVAKPPKSGEPANASLTSTSASAAARGL